MINHIPPYSLPFYKLGNGYNLYIQCGPIRNSPPSLVRAAEDGKIQEVQQLIDDGSDVNDRDCVSSYYFKPTLLHAIIDHTPTDTKLNTIFILNFRKDLLH